MLAGRVFYGIMNAFIFKAGSYSISIWLASAFITSLPGIGIQLILIPFLVHVMQKSGLINGLPASQKANDMTSLE
jgi:niacin transporter